MKKLTLELDELRVESFGTDEEPTARGTVQANSLPTRPMCQGGETHTCTLEWCC